MSFDWLGCLFLQTGFGFVVAVATVLVAGAVLQRWCSSTLCGHAGGLCLCGQ